MSYRIVFSTEAEEELQEIALYMQGYDPKKAELLVNAIIDYFNEVLAVFPKSGKVYLKHIRKLTYKKYTAFYVVNEKLLEIEIIHLVDLAKPLEARGIDLG